MRQHITAQEWKRLKTWKERILLYQEIYELPTFPEVAKALGATNGNVVSWFLGKSQPTPYMATQMRRACVNEADEDKEAVWNTVMTQSYDCSLNFYNHCLVSKDAAKLTTALCLIGNKVLKLLYSGEGFMKSSTFLCYRDSLFGAFPAWERITLTPAALKHITLKMVVSHSNEKFVLAAEIAVRENIVFEYSVSVSDANLVKFAKKVSTELSRILKAESTPIYGKQRKHIQCGDNIPGSSDSKHNAGSSERSKTTGTE